MKNRHILILGKSGGGKSELARQLIRSGFLGSRIVLLDPDGEFEDLRGFETVTVDEFLEQVERRQIFYYRIELLDDETIIDDVNDICDACFELENVTIVCEEIADYSQSPKMRTMWRRARKRGIVMVGISQRTQDVHKTITSQARTVAMYWDDEPNTLLAIKARFGQGVMMQVKDLDPNLYKPVVVGKGDDETVKKINSLTGYRKGVK